MGCGFIQLFYYADDLFKFRHQVCLVLQAACGVDHQKICSFRARLLDGLVGKTCGIATDFCFDDGRADALSPDGELLNGGCAECVACGQHDRLSFCPGLGRYFADGGCLAGAVHPDDEDDERLFVPGQGEGLFNRCEVLGDLFGQNAPYLVG